MKKDNPHQYDYDVKECILNFKPSFWFCPMKTAWLPDHRSSWTTQHKYISMQICKPFEWTIVQYIISQVRELANLLKYMQLPSMFNDTWIKMPFGTQGTRG